MKYVKVNEIGQSLDMRKPFFKCIFRPQIHGIGAKLKATLNQILLQIISGLLQTAPM